MYARTRPPIGHVLRPFFSPLHATAVALAQQPPTLVLTAQIDVARGEGERYVQLLNSAVSAAAAAEAAATEAATEAAAAAAAGTTEQCNSGSNTAATTAAAAAAAAVASAVDPSTAQHSSDSTASSTTTDTDAATAGTVRHKCVQMPRAMRGFFARTRHEGGKHSLQEAERFIGLHCGVSHLLEND
jgi:membrane protein involved in colicin uptake